MALNSRMPQSLRKWGCDRLYLTFGNALPPTRATAKPIRSRG